MRLGGSLQERAAKKIRELRRASGLTQEAVAHRAGIAPRHFQKVEAGEVNLTLDTLSKLASALGTDPSELLRPPSDG